MTGWPPLSAPNIAVPAAQPADHPGQARERALGVRVLALDGLAFELPGEEFDQGLSGLVHGVGELLAGRSRPRIDRKRRSQAASWSGWALTYAHGRSSSIALAR